MKLDGRFLPHLAAFDTTEHVHDGWVDVMLWPGDRERLRATGATWEVAVEDWHRAFLEERRDLGKELSRLTAQLRRMMDLAQRREDGLRRLEDARR